MFWLQDVEQSFARDVPKILVGCKEDLDKLRTVTDKEASEFARDHNMEYMSISAKNGRKINQIFEKLVRSIMSKDEKKIIEELSIEDENEHQNNKCKCF